MSFLLNHYYTRDAEQSKFQAAIHGIDIGEENKTGSTKNHVPSKSNGKTLVFGDPTDYAHMSESEREKLTSEMMAKHRHWAQNSKVR